MIGKVQRLKLRDVWKHEALDFTTWLENNIDVLNDALDLRLINVEREQNAGTFNADLVAEHEAGGVVIIENQLEKSDHDHLGKVLTYLTSLEAQTAIWIVAEPRPEHVKAITWLNETSAATFYLVKIEAIRIGESLPAPLLTLITGPSPEAIEAGDKKKELAGRYVTRKLFWAGLLDLAKSKTKLHAGISPGHRSGVGTSAGLPAGLSLNYAIRQYDGQVELYIDADQDSGEGNTEILNQILMFKEAIERDFGEELEWESLEGKRACRICKIITVGGYKDENKWPEVQEQMVDNMIKLDKALRPHLDSL